MLRILVTSERAEPRTAGSTDQATIAPFIFCCTKMVLSDHSKIISISSVVHFAVNWLLLFHRFDSQLGFDGSLRGVGFKGS